MPEIRDVKLNFAAAKLTVTGTVSEEELLREARKVEPITLHAVNAPVANVSTSFWQSNRKVIRVTAAGLLMAAGWVLYVGNAAPYGQIAFLASILLGSYNVALRGARNLLRFEFDMNVLMTVAVTGAVLLGQWEEATVVAFLFAISEMLESYSMEKARQSIRSLMEIAPKEASVIRDGQEIVVPVEELLVGDELIVRPGEKIPIDGTIEYGSTTIHEAAITGESMPAEKTVGDSVFAGTLNQQGAIRLRVTKLVQDTAIAKIIHLVEEAQTERAPAQAFVDKFARVYTPTVILLAVLVAVIPALWLGGSWQHWIYEALALLVVACPCALVVSTPVAIVTAIGTAAKHGVLIKGGIYLEQAATLNAVAFDKTGTLTKGEPEVTEIVPLQTEQDSSLGQLDENELLRIAAGLESLSEHPLAKAIIRKAQEKGLQLQAPEEFAAIPGKGACGTIGGTKFYVGNTRLFSELSGTEEQVPEAVRLQQEGKTVMLVGTDKHLLGVLAVADKIRDESRSSIERLKATGIEKTVLLTGDNKQTAAAIAKQAGVDEYYGELLPEDKLEHVKQLRMQYRQTAMVGDGINDAPALAAASLGIAMGGAGTDTALETADVVLMGDDLSKLPYTVDLCKAALRVIKQNIAFSLIVKLIAVLLVFPGWLTLWMAILADMGATIAVTINGLRLLRKRP